MEINFWEHREPNSGLQGEKQERYLCAVQPLPLTLYNLFGVNRL